MKLTRLIDTMKALIKFIKRHFELNQHESLSVIYGVGLILLLATGVWAYDSYTSKLTTAFILSNYENLEAPLQKLNEEKAFFQENYRKERKAKAESVINHSVFNPNTASLEILTANGISTYAARNLINFRNKGKVYKTKEELLKVYGFNEAMYTKIEPYIDLPSKAEKSVYPKYEKYKKDTSSSKKYKKYVPRVIEPFDINQASSIELQQIYGIGEVYAKRIIKYRDGLGGFHTLNQIKGTYGLSDSTFREIEKVVFLKAGVKKVKVNSILLEDFHFSALKKYQKKAIIAYRKQHGPYENITDLAKIRILNQELLDQIAPYLDFSKP